VDQELRERVEGALREAWRKPVRVTEAERLSTGANQEIWALTAVSEGSEAPLILRRPPGFDQEDDLASLMLTGKQVEIELQRTLHGLGINVPEVIAELDDGEGSGMSFIMERLPGVAVPQKILGDDSYAAARSALVQQMADSLARVHNVSTAALPPLPSLTAADQLNRFRVIVDGCELHHPGLEVAFAWLDAHRPTESTATLVHGDFRLRNVIVDHAGLSGIIDWELAHLGDPMSDLAWLCMRSWRFSRPELPAAGLGTRGQLFDAYAKAANVDIEPERVRFWEAFGNVRWAVICLLQVRRFLVASPEDSHIEHAAIGRRLDEALYDFFHLIDEEEYPL
jgi:aminoglycoside phosphotransferase (APT) family kinase protein